jgi:hypothetical protein
VFTKLLHSPMRNRTPSGFGQVSGPNETIERIETLDRIETAADVDEPEQQSETETAPAPDHAGVTLLNQIGSTRTRDAALLAERAELLGAIIELNDQISTWLAAVDAVRKREAAIELEVLQAECREQRKVCETLANANGRAQDVFNRSVKGRHDCESELRLAVQDTPDPNTWPTDAQLAKAKARVTAARKALATAGEEESVSLAQFNAATQQFETGREKLRIVALEEKRARAAVAGKAEPDPELGLIAE